VLCFAGRTGPYQVYRRVGAEQEVSLIVKQGPARRIIYMLMLELVL
jgi:hypothetical protein